LTGFLSPAHFIEPLASTLIWVALLLCTAHHHLLHEGSFTARRRTNGTLAFADRRGHEIHALVRQ
jgi:hypothetical protein